MDKNKFIFGILIVFLLLSISFTLATETQARSCLINKINEKKCSTLSTEEQIFSLLTASKCKSEVESILEKNPKTTAQAILALNEVGSDTDSAETWLQAQTQASSDLNWYLQIINSESTTCKISYDSKEYTININKDKEISSRAGTCLNLAQGDYWLEVNSDCYDKKFTISCDKSFFTNLLYQREDSSIIYLPGQINSASADSTTEERVDSLCFEKDGHCDYESTLWAALALDKKELDIHYYLPYLISMANENENYLPESFLYLLTGNKDYKDNLLLKQNPTSYYWEESDNRYYDTAVALYGLQDDDSQQKTDTLKWLLEVQDKDGCWRGITETAFILYAGFPEGAPKIVDNGDEGIEEKEEGIEEKEEDEPIVIDDEEKSYWYIWVLIILIVLTIVGIVFKDKIRPYWFRLKSGFGKGKPSKTQGPPPPGFIPPPTPRQRLMPRRILPQRSSAKPRHPIPRKSKTPRDKEFSDVLNKLKEIGS